MCFYVGFVQISEVWKLACNDVYRRSDCVNYFYSIIVPELNVSTYSLGVSRAMIVAKYVGCVRQMLEETWSVEVPLIQGRIY